MNQVPLRLTITPLPPAFAGTPQDLFDALEARAEIVSDQAFSLFTVGTVAPTSDYGPFFLNGLTPYGWDPAIGAYRPMTLDPVSLRYTILPTGSLPADNTNYDVVFETNPGSTPAGAPVTIDLWYNGAWTPFPWLTSAALAPYSTTVQMNAAIASAVGAQVRYPFKASKLASAQVITAGSPEAQVVFDNEEYDPNTAFASNAFTAPHAGYYHFTGSVLLDLDSGSPTVISIKPTIRKNSVDVMGFDNESDTDTSGRTYNFGCDLALAAGDVVDVGIVITTTGASTWSVENDERRTFFSGFLIQAI